MFLILLIRFVARIQRFLIPSGCFFQILINSESKIVAITDYKNCGKMPLICCKLKVFQSFFIVLFYSFAIIIVPTQVIACCRIPLFRSKSGIFKGLLIVLLYNFTSIIEISQRKLCWSCSFPLPIFSMLPIALPFPLPIVYQMQTHSSSARYMPSPPVIL